jgi:LacI family transcriptional regulator
VSEGDGPRTRASMRKVAERADVAISSVSRVLSGHPDVSAKMRERVLAAVAELEYEPDFLAQSLRRGQTLSVGFVVGDISNPMLSGFVHGAESELRKAGYSLLLMDSEKDPALDVRSISFFQTRRVDGMLLSLVSESAPGLIEALRQVRVPVVLVDREVADDIGASTVQSDHTSGMAEAVRHLIELGHRRIALVNGPDDIAPGRARERGLRQAIEAQGHDIEATVMAGPLSAEHGFEATEALLDGENPPSAIVCGGNQLLVGCLRALNGRDIQVGRDLSLVTCDHVPISELFRPRIASITRDPVELGRMAAELMVRGLQDEVEAETVVLPTEFVATESCAPPVAR